MNSLSLDQIVKDYLKGRLSGVLNYFAVDRQIATSKKYKSIIEESS